MKAEKIQLAEQLRERDEALVPCDVAQGQEDPASRKGAPKTTKLLLIIVLSIIIINDNIVIRVIIIVLFFVVVHQDIYRAGRWFTV